MLPGICSKFSQELAWGHCARHYGGRAAQEIEPIRADDQFSDLAAGAQMGEGLGKADLVIHFEQEVGDPDLWQAAIKIEHHGIGLFGNSGSQTIDLEVAVCDALICRILAAIQQLRAPPVHG